MTQLRVLLLLCFLVVHTRINFTLSHDVPGVPPFEIVSLETILQKYGHEIGYQKFQDAQEVTYEPLPFAVQEFALKQPYHVTFDETWVLTIPRGRVSSIYGRVLIDEKYMLRDLLCHCGWFGSQMQILNQESHFFNNVRKVSGRVAVIVRSGSENYAHFLVDVLGRLAILEIMGIDYDWLYIPYDKPYVNKPYIKQVLAAWGINPCKIIEPCDEFACIEADELIVPSLTARLKPTPKVTFWNMVDLCATYWPTWVTDYYRYKFLPLVNKTAANEDRFSKRIFISRRDSYWRVLLNEDDVFALFEPYGFKRYVMSDLTFLEQVELFSKAEMVVGAHGPALANMMFCPADTKIFEIFQERSDCSLAFLAQSLGLDYTPIKTVDFPLHDYIGFNYTVAPLGVFEEVIKSL